MQCSNDILPQKGKVPAIKGSSKQKTQTHLKRKRVAPSQGSSDTAFLNSHTPAAAVSQGNPVMIFGLLAGGLGLILVLLLFFLASSSSNSSHPQVSQGEHHGDGGTHRPPKKETIGEKIQKELALMEKTTKDPKKKLYFLKQLKSNYEAFLASPKGKALSKEIMKIEAKNRYLATLDISKKYHNLADKMDLWKRAAENLKGSEYEKKAKEEFQRLKTTFLKLAEKEYDQVVMKAKSLAAEEKFEEAIKALESFPFEYRQTKYWTKKIPIIKEKYTQMKNLQEEYGNLEFEVTQSMDMNDFDGAYKLCQEYLSKSPPEKWKEKVQKLLKDIEKRKKEYLEEKRKEEERKRKEQERKERLKKELERLKQSLKGGQWVNIFNGRDLMGWSMVGNWKVSNGVIYGEGGVRPAPLLFVAFLLRNYSLKFEVNVSQGYFWLVSKYNRSTGLMMLPFGDQNIQISRGKVYSIPMGSWVQFNVKIKGEEAFIQTNVSGFRSIRAKLKKAVGYLGFLLPPNSKVSFRNIQLKLEP
ncbi:MAG: DUF1080 domain-containing protein [Planctomycetota bacterium]|nr:MAG: DUF1080 domain-containing protein [Planctomycetota bacterium]